MDFFVDGIGTIPGLFSWSHLIYTTVSIALIAGILILTRNKSNDQIKKYIKIISIAVAFLEVLKIVWNVTLRTTVEVNDYVR